MKDINLANFSKFRNQKQQGYINVSGTNIKLPITIICGKKEGKTALITGGVHCAEYVGIETAIELSKEINPEDISGNIIIVPLINRSGFENRTMSVVYEDGKIYFHGAKEEHKIDTIKLITRLDLDSWPYTGNIGFVNSQGNWEYRDASLSTSGRVVTLKLSEPITTKQIQPNISVYPGSGSGKVNISEIKLYEYDSLEKDVDNLFADDLKLSLNSDVTREKVEELVKRANTIDPVNLEYHPNKDEILNCTEEVKDTIYSYINEKSILFSNNYEINNINVYL